MQTEIQTEKKSLLRSFGSFWVAGTSILGTLLVLLIISFVVLVAKADETETSSLNANILHKGEQSEIAVVDIAGVIVDEVGGGDPFGLEQGTATVRQLSKIFTELENSKDVKAVVLRINSPGGSVVASDELYLSIKKLAENKVVIAQLNDTAASGGYYAALGADKIIANKATITGSIGVIAQFPEFTELFEKIGVEVRTIKSGNLKDIGSFDRPMTEEERAILENIVDDAYQQFIDAMVDGRGFSREEATQLADGRIYSGVQAKELGLVDELGTYTTALELAKSEANLDDPSIVEYTQESFFSMLFASVQQVNPTAELAKVVPSTKFGVYYMLSL
jgi:protease-4